MLQRCAKGVKNEQPTAARGISEAPLPAWEQARHPLRDLCQRLCVRCSAEPSPCSDQPFSTSLPFLRGLCSPPKMHYTGLVLLDGVSTSSIRLVSPPLLSRAGNETASLLDTVSVVQRSPAHQGWRLGSRPGKHGTYPQPFRRISKRSGINCSPASNSLIDVISN